MILGALGGHANGRAIVGRRVRLDVSVARVKLRAVPLFQARRVGATSVGGHIINARRVKLCDDAVQNGAFRHGAIDPTGAIESRDARHVGEVLVANFIIDIKGIIFISVTNDASGSAGPIREIDVGAHGLVEIIAAGLFVKIANWLAVFNGIFLEIKRTNHFANMIIILNLR